MAFLKRLSSNFNLLAYLSPSKPDQAHQADLLQKQEKVGHKRKRTSSATSPGASSRKRPAQYADYSPVAHLQPPRLSKPLRRRIFTPLDHDVPYEEIVHTIEASDERLPGDEEDINVTPIKRERTDSPIPNEEEDHNDEIPFAEAAWSENPDDSAILDERSFHLTSGHHAVDDALISPQTHPRIIHGPEDLGQPHFSTSHLRSLGKDEDYITLLHRIVLRGYEPLLPAHMRFDFPFLPDELFAANNDPWTGADSGAAFLSSPSPPSSSAHFRATKEFDHLMDLSSRVRDRVEMAEHFTIPPTPEEAVHRHLYRYYNFLFGEAGLDAQTRIPVLAMVFGGVKDSAALLRAEATRKCAALAERWRGALAGIGGDDARIPTLYAIVASHTIIAIMSYSPRQDDEGSHNDENRDGDEEESEPQCAGMAILDLSDANNAVWDALALACVGCHARNVMVRMTRLTGVGLLRLEEEEVNGERMGASEEEDLDG
jgi:hypothetical protein